MERRHQERRRQSQSVAALENKNPLPSSNRRGGLLLRPDLSEKRGGTSMLDRTTRLSGSFQISFGHHEKFRHFYDCTMPSQVAAAVSSLSIGEFVKASSVRAQAACMALRHSGFEVAAGVGAGRRICGERGHHRGRREHFSPFLGCVTVS
jgi:hypothetical protein